MMRCYMQRTKGLSLGLAMLTGGLLGQLSSMAQAGERKFLVILATSPKQYNNGLPPGGLPNPQLIRNQYFDKINPGIDSFAEYWEEISYGDVTITGKVTDWISLPWAILPRVSPGNFVDLDFDGNYQYGRGEKFDNKKAAVIVDLTGNPEGADDGPFLVDENPAYARGAELKTVRGDDVWTPGERFLDMDGDGRWDGLDEATNLMDWNEDGRPDNLGPWVDLNSNGIPENAQDCVYLRDSDNDANPDCCPNGSNAPGCKAFPTQNACPPTFWNIRNNILVNDCNGNLIPDACDIDCGSAACTQTGWVAANDPARQFCGKSFDRSPVQATGDACVPTADTIPDECQITSPENRCVAGVITCAGDNLDPCCADTNQGTRCIPLNPLRVPVARCEYHDANGNGALDIVEPFENGVAVAKPATPVLPTDPPVVCENRISPTMVSENFPGPVAKVIGYGTTRTIGGVHDPLNKAPLECLCSDGEPCRAVPLPGGGVLAKACPAGEHAEYNPPDSWTEGPSNKMRVRVPLQVLFTTPEPTWYKSAWRDRYNGADPPRWESRVLEATPATQEELSQRRMFLANRGGTNGNGTGWVGCGANDRLVAFQTGICGNFEQTCNRRILPEESNGIGAALTVYDGWVEFDDMPSSKYHRKGDQNLGEVTSPFNDSIFGHDRGRNDGSGSAPDGIIPAAGPYATGLHGNLGRDAGNQLQIEALTWRTAPPFNDGTAWQQAYGYHPYASPSGANLGFRDYNLDGLIDLGETTPPGSENYVADHSEGSTTPNRPRGTGTDYPWNRRRLLEDCIQILDDVIDFDDFVDPVSLDRVYGGEFLAGSSGPNGGFHLSAVKGLNSGIVLLPNDAHIRFDFLEAPGFYPIHNEDGLNDPNFVDSTFPSAPGTPRYNWNIWFHDLVISLNGTSEGNVGTGGFQSAYSAHEYLHSWENFPDLYDYDIYDQPPIIENCPVGAWDIMADGGLVHPSGPLKERNGTQWIEAVDLATVLTPGVSKTITLPSAEFIRDNSYYFFENEDRAGEKFYFWSAGLGFDENLPGAGMLIMHTDVGSNPEALPAQQRIGDRFLYHIVQADGLSQLDVCDNRGDAGDVWPGSTNKRDFDCNTLPAAEWWTLNSCTGLEVTDIVPDGNGSVRATFNWTPTSIPGLRFVNPPGGVTVGSNFQIRSEVTDVFGGTTVRYFYTKVESSTPKQSDGTPIGLLKKTSPGTLLQSINWNVAGLADGRYFIFADLIPGSGSDGTELKLTTPRAGRNNEGTAKLNKSDVAVDVSTIANGVVTHDGKARSETWVAECVDSVNGRWVVRSSLTQPVPDGDVSASLCNEQLPATCANRARCATTGTQYTSCDGEVKFTIAAGGGALGKGAVGDTFTFTTTGLTAPSAAVTLTSGQISENPTAIIDASPLSGLPPLTVTFDARRSRDPNGQPLTFTWNFGDGSATQTGAQVQRTFTQARKYTVVLRATNTANGRFGEAAVDIEVINNSPKAVIKGTPSSGPAPLTVSFSGSDSSDAETPASQLIYQWNFGDGITANDQRTPGILRETTHLYTRKADGTLCTNANPCLFTATLTVTDPGGKSSTDTLVISVGNTNPVANVTFSTSQGNSPLVVVFNAKNSTDAENDTLSVEWNWGDGSAKETYPAKTGKPPATDGSVSHTYTLAAGQTSATFKPTAVVKDNRGGSATWPGTTITVSSAGQTDSSPRALFTVSPAQPVLNQKFVVDASQSFDRPTGGRITKYEWEWGDGTPRSTGVTAEHTYTLAGRYTITLTVSDAETPPNKASSQKTIVMSSDSTPPPGTNRPPTASLIVVPLEGFVDELFTFDARGSVDPDGDDLTYRFVFGDGDETAFTATATATHRFAEPGTYLTRLTVRDEANASVDLTRSIRVLAPGENRTPVALIATGLRTGVVPLTLTFDGRLSFDPDADPVTYDWSFSLDGAVVETLTGSVVTRLFDEVGTYTVVLSLTDSKGAVGFSNPESVVVTERGTPIEPPPPQPRPTPEPPPPSYTQRPPTVCGVGMAMALFGSLLGLATMRSVRRRQTPR